MSRNRIVYQNWIVELGYDPSQKEYVETWLEGDTELVSLDTPGATSIDTNMVRHCSKRVRLIQHHVTQALLCLSVEEREFIEQFYYMGKTYREMSEKTGRAVYKLEALHKRALRKLKKALQAFVQTHWQLPPSKEQTNNTGCPVCQSPHRDEIDTLIANRDRTKTWRPILRQLREQYGIIIRSPQVLIGHEKYHATQ